MIPGRNGILDAILEFKEIPSRTYKLNTGNGTIAGYTDELEAVKQAVFLILNTERYEHVIYSWNYGVELAELMGKPVYEVLSEIPSRITDALLQDARIERVDGFTFEVKKGIVHTKFVAHTIFGDTEIEKEVAV